MTKTQIQVPEELFSAIKGFAKRRECSVAETFRLGAELLFETYPGETTPFANLWGPLSSKQVGWKGLDADQRRYLAFARGFARAWNPLAG